MASLIIAMLALASTERVQWEAFVAAPVIWQEATRAGVDPYLVAAIAWKESRFTPSARSRTGDCGIMQVNPRWSPYNCVQLLDLRTGIRAGIQSMLYWRKRFGKREPNYEWLCHYNSGNKCWRRSRAYARKVRSLRSRLLKPAYP